MRDSFSLGFPRSLEKGTDEWEDRTRGRRDVLVRVGLGLDDSIVLNGDGSDPTRIQSRQLRLRGGRGYEFDSHVVCTSTLECFDDVLEDTELRGKELACTTPRTLDEALDVHSVLEQLINVLCAQVGLDQRWVSSHRRRESPLTTTG